MSNRRIGLGERIGNPLTNQKLRDRADSRRQIEGLSQNDQIIALLGEQNDLLRYIADLLHREASKGD